MTPQNQEFLYLPEIGQSGDCQRAVLASLLDMPISEVPMLQNTPGDVSDYWDALQNFLADRGYAYLTVPARGGALFYGDCSKPVYHEISGPSPRNMEVKHAVVGMNGRIAFDPHPDKTGLAGDPSQWFFSYLVKTCE